MKLLDLIFVKNPKDKAEIFYPKLGKLVWDKVGLEWKGQFNGLVFTLWHEKNQLKPEESLMEYAYMVLSNVEYMAECLEKEKTKLLNIMPEIDSEQRLEVKPLIINSIGFYRREKEKYALVLLGPDDTEFSWRMEFKNNECLGIGCDD